MALARKVSDQLKAFCELATRLADFAKVDAILLLVERPTDWPKLRAALGDHHVVLAAAMPGVLDANVEDEFDVVELNTPDAPVYEQLTQALLEAVAEEYFPAGATVVTGYSGFEAGAIDSISLIRLDEHLGRLTVRDLRQIETTIPFETLKLVVDLAVEIGREGREGKSVGTLFVVGDHRKVSQYCNAMGFDPVRGYKATERRLQDSKVREGVKEIAQMDGAFVVSADGIVMAASQFLSTPPAANLALPKGLGARHWAAAEITCATKAIAVAVSASGGTVRVFQNGEVVLRIEPFRRAMKWKDFDTEPPAKPPAGPSPAPGIPLVDPDSLAADKSPRPGDPPVA